MEQISNKETIQECLQGKYTIGCYDNDIERLSKKELKKVLDNIFEEATDIIVKVRNKVYVVELTTVDEEKDFNLLTKAEYISRYGSEKFE